jgi:hypothetical protein
VVPLVHAGEGELLGEGLADLLRASQLDSPMLVVMIDNSEPEEAGLLSGLAGALASVTEPEPEAVEEALSWGFLRAGDEGRFAMVRVRGGCRLASEESGCRR